jgi:membrane protein DedA with SNARE-associated domain
MLGALPWYWVGRLLRHDRLISWLDRYGKWLGISAGDIDKSQRWFDQHGVQAVFFCRLVPGVRTLISAPAGMSAMPMIAFLIYSTLGTTIWVSLLAYAGFLLGENYTLVEQYLDPISKLVLIGLVLAVVYWLVKKFQQKQAEQQSK